MRCPADNAQHFAINLSFQLASLTFFQTMLAESFVVLKIHFTLICRQKHYNNIKVSNVIHIIVLLLKSVFKDATQM